MVSKSYRPGVEVVTEATHIEIRTANMGVIRIKRVPSGGFHIYGDAIVPRNAGTPNEGVRWIAMRDLEWLQKGIATAIEGL